MASVKVYVTVGNESLLIEGDVPVPDVRAMFDVWLQVVTPAHDATQAQIDVLAARIAAMKMKLGAAIADAAEDSPHVAVNG